MFRQIIINTTSRKLCTSIFTINKSVSFENQCKLCIAIPRCLSTINAHPDERNLEITNSTKEQSKLRSERELFLNIKSDPDTFGSSGREKLVDKGDKEEEQYLENRPSPSQRLRTKQYADIIKNLIRKHKIKEAIDVLEVQMIQEDRVKPEAYIYNLILGACGRVGYTKKAFALYNKMKQRNLKIMGGTYTALFNACANSPWPQDGLDRAIHLRKLIEEKGHALNKITYNAMIKAFGRCGDIKTAFEIADEMAMKKLPMADDTLNFLLQSCISDKSAGFRHALLVWRKFNNKGVKPSVYCYNLMLRCIRECGLGEISDAQEEIKKILDDPQNQSNAQKLLGDGNDSLSSSNETESLSKQTDLVSKNCFPNLLSENPQLGNVISISEINSAEDRLLLVGGLTGFLSDMVNNKCNPDIKTFTLLLDVIPNTTAAEKELLHKLKDNNVKPDIDFYNMVMKRRCLRGDYEGAKIVVNMIKNKGKRPDLITYGILAMSCRTKQQARELIDEMNEASYRLNIPILGAMLHQACYHMNFQYVLYTMELCVTEELKPNKQFMEKLEEFRRKCKDISNDKDHKLSATESFIKGFKLFRQRYKTWLTEIKIDDTEDAHPWHQYRTTTDTDVRHFKDKEARFKAQHTSLFKQKRSVRNN